jgi:hypothetical protein
MWKERFKRNKTGGRKVSDRTVVEVKETAEESLREGNESRNKYCNY